MARVLIIEESVEVRKLLLLLLQRSGHQVYEAATAGIGFTLAQDIQPDLIVLDLELPGVNGWAMLRLFKAYARTKHIPVIAMTTQAEASQHMGDQQNGFVAILEKPFDIGSLLKHIASNVQHVSNIPNAHTKCWCY
jgi:DNA-binding response OmpR family regulator